jgi:hypothetical protein
MSMTMSETRMNVLRLAAKGNITRKDVEQKLGIKSGFCSLLGHADPAKVEAGSLVGLGYLAVVASLNGSRLTTYAITPAGMKLVK